MITFSKQRLTLFGLLIAAALIIWLFNTTLSAFFGRFTYFSGWVLLLVMVALTAYNPRKKLPFLPLKSSAAWLKYHVFVGWFAVFLFLVHVSFKLPTGWFEGILACLYVLVTASGILGLAISRALPKRMTARGGEVLFERIPIIRRQLHERAEAAALKSVTDGNATSIADFYVRDLSPFFVGSRNFWAHLAENRAPVNRLLDKIIDLNRFLDEKERATMAQIGDLVRQKDGLDYQYASQLTLRLWLFVHIPLTYGLLLWSAVHVILVYAFSGGAGR